MAGHAIHQGVVNLRQLGLGRVVAPSINDQAGLGAKHQQALVAQADVGIAIAGGGEVVTFRDPVALAQGGSRSRGARNGNCAGDEHNLPCVGQGHRDTSRRGLGRGRHCGEGSHCDQQHPTGRGQAGTHCRAGTAGKANRKSSSRNHKLWKISLSARCA